MSGQSNGATGLVVAGQYVSGPGLAKVEMVPPLEFTPEQSAMIRNSFANGASASEFAVLMEVAKARRLNPLLKQIFFVKRWDSQKRCDVWSTQTSIDGLRAIAQRTGLYAGQDEPEWIENARGEVVACKVRVYRKDWGRPCTGVVYWNEYVQTTKDGNPTRFWQNMPRNQIAKCAEAAALRKAFPEDMSGLYVDAEMDQADNEAPRFEPVSRTATTVAPKELGPSSAALFEALCDRVDAAENGAALNKIASDTIKAHTSGLLTDEQRGHIAKACNQKGKAFGPPPKPPTSAPEMDPSGYSADEAEYEAEATGGDS